MKLLLYSVSTVWLLCGVALLALALLYPDLVTPQMPAPAPQAEQAPPATVAADIAPWLPWFAGVAWVVLFLMPALGLAALAAVLGKLDRHTASAAADAGRRERAEPPRKRPPGEKVEPTIGRL